MKRIVPFSLNSRPYASSVDFGLAFAVVGLGLVLLSALTKETNNVLGTSVRALPDASATALGIPRIVQDGTRPEEAEPVTEREMKPAPIAVDIQTLVDHSGRWHPIDVPGLDEHSLGEFAFEGSD